MGGCVRKPKPQPVAVLPPPQAQPRPTLIIRPLDLYLSARFNTIDVYFRRPPSDTTRLPAQSRCEMQYRNKTKQDVRWIDKPLQRLEGTAGRFATVTDLDPMTEYEVRARLISETGDITLAETPVKTITTSALVSAVAVRSYKAKVDFKNRVEHEISTKVGDILEQDASRFDGMPNNSDFIYARNVRTSQVGYVPLVILERNPAGDRPGLVQDQDYFFNINRRKAEIWMMRPNVEPGRFIVRPSHSSEFMALSVRFGVTADGVPRVEHFKIYIMSDGYGCYLNPPVRTFEDINQLIEHFKSHTLCSNLDICLSDPFPRNLQPPTNVDEIAIPATKLQLLNKIGIGNFGEVHKAKLNNLEVAVKKLLPPSHQSAYMASSGDELLNEAKEMAQYCHDNLVRIIAVCIDAEPFMIVSELMNRGSLLQWLNDDSAVGDIQLSMVVFILSQIACGMAYLSERQVIHRDLRAANVLVHDENNQLEIKITDFGLTRRIKDEDEGIYTSSRDAVFPVRWTAPEAYSKSRPQFSVKTDVWSFGILAYEVVTLGGTPYPALTKNDDVFKFVLSGGRITLEECRSYRRKVKQVTQVSGARPPEEICPDSLFAEISNCWKNDPQSRPTFSALYDFLDNFELCSSYRNT